MAQSFTAKVRICKEFLASEESKKFFAEWEYRAEQFANARKECVGKNYTRFHTAAASIIYNFTAQDAKGKFQPCRPQKLAWLMVNTLAETPQETLNRIFSAILFLPRTDIEEFANSAAQIAELYIWNTQERRNARPRAVLIELVDNFCQRGREVAKARGENYERPNLDERITSKSADIERFFETAKKLFADEEAEAACEREEQQKETEKWNKFVTEFRALLAKTAARDLKEKIRARVDVMKYRHEHYKYERGFQAFDWQANEINTEILKEQEAELLAEIDRIQTELVRVRQRRMEFDNTEFAYLASRRMRNFRANRAKRRAAEQEQQKTA